ncbi:MAG TPA: BcsE family c-di-GMP-binding protein, partial [Nevskiaceae bacterium]|nr:BcsE family c-di-GMP-binding protein [Nevskiaceae bacterium]
MARRDPFPVSLGIEGLPPASAQMEPDAAYAVGVPLPHALPALVCGMAARALLDRRPVTLVCGSDTAEIVRRLTAHGLDAPAEMAAGRLVVLQLSDSLDTKLGHFGASRVIEELEYFCKPRGRLLILAPAEQLLVANNPRLAARQAELYARWCTASRAAAVFVFSGNSVASACARQAVDGWFAGVARMSGDGLRLNWQVEHWRSPEGSIGSREYGISVAHDGALLVADGGLRSSSLKIVEAPDYDTVLAVAAAVRHEKSRPAHWQLVGGHEALLTRASSAVAATFILDCG